MLGGGLEPPQDFSHMALNHARLPVPPSQRFVYTKKNTPVFLPKRSGIYQSLRMKSIVIVRRTEAATGYRLCAVIQ